MSCDRYPSTTPGNALRRLTRKPGNRGFAGVAAPRVLKAAQAAGVSGGGIVGPKSILQAAAAWTLQGFSVVTATGDTGDFAPGIAGVTEFPVSGPTKEPFI